MVMMMMMDEDAAVCHARPTRATRIEIGQDRRFQEWEKWCQTPANKADLVHRSNPEVKHEVSQKREGKQTDKTVERTDG